MTAPSQEIKVPRRKLDPRTPCGLPLTGAAAAALQAVLHMSHASTAPSRASAIRWGPVCPTPTGVKLATMPLRYRPNAVPDGWFCNRRGISESLAGGRGLQWAGRVRNISPGDYGRIAGAGANVQRLAPAGTA